MAVFKAVVWALIFLTKLRFPPGVSIAIVLKDHKSFLFGDKFNFANFLNFAAIEFILHGQVFVFKTETS